MYGVMRDSSSVCVSPALGYAATLMAPVYIPVLYVGRFLIFWVATMGDKAKAAASAKSAAEAGGIPAMAGGSPALDVPANRGVRGTAVRSDRIDDLL